MRGCAVAVHKLTGIGIEALMRAPSGVKYAMSYQMETATLVFSVISKN